MKQLVCEMCGGTDIQKEDGVFVCKSCGCKYSLEEARKLMIEGTVDVSGSTIKVDSSEKLNNLYQLARRAKDDNNSDNAKKYYDQIVLEDPTSWEAAFYAVYYSAVSCKIGQIGNAAYAVKNSIGSTFELIKKYVASEKQKDAYMDVASRVEALGEMLLLGATKHYYDNASATGIISEVGNWNASILNMLETLGDKLNSEFDDKDAAVSAYKKSIELKDIAGKVRGVTDYWISSVNNKIVGLDSSYQVYLDNQKIDNEIQKLQGKSNLLRKTKDTSKSLLGSGSFITCCGIVIGLLAVPLNSYGILITGIVFAVLGIIELLCIPSKKKSFVENQKKADEIDVQIEELKKKKK